MTRVHRLEATRQVVAHALSRGGEFVSLTQYRWDLAGNCTAPVPVLMEGRADTRKGERGLPLDLQLETRCRRCRNCLRYRAWVWRERCQVEVHAAFRTWFGTLTLRPEEHYRAELVAAARLRARGVTFENLSPSEQFSERHATITQEVTRWLKRIRKVSGAKLRFCLVAEEHKSGLPHYHILIHEVRFDQPVTKRQLQEQWRLGFTQFKLVQDDRAAAYVTKYLTKSVQARVRASLHYGKDALSIDAIATGVVKTTPSQKGVSQSF